MKIFLYITATFVCLLSLVTADECDEVTQKLSEIVCDQTVFDDYYKCVKERQSIRQKRQLICPITGEPINQVVQPLIQPAQVLQPSVTQDIVAPIGQQMVSQNVQPAFVQPIITQDVQPAYQVQQIPVQQATIQQVPFQQAPIQQVPIQSPRYILQPGTIDTINRNVEIVGSNSSVVHAERIPNVRNITTVIKLNNYINNTNHINVPTHINSTNVNNITIYTNFTDKYGLGSTSAGPCCFVVQPKRCHTTPAGPRCHHKRHKTCGTQCTSRIVHVRNHGCGSHGCHVNYAPQPSPKCVYNDYWPYVNCGHRRRDPCDGCYDYDPYYAPPPECNGCYDEGFEYGQLYRRGPVLRPHYQPEPPCELSGTCDDYDIDHGFPRDSDVIEENEEDSSGVENDLGVSIAKCKVVSDDGSISIKNCTVELDNQYAAARSQDLVRTHRSHLSMMPPPPPPMPYYYMPPPPPYPMAYPYPYQPMPAHMRRHHGHSRKHKVEKHEYTPPRPVEDDYELEE